MNNQTEPTYDLLLGWHDAILVRDALGVISPDGPEAAERANELFHVLDEWIEKADPFKDEEDAARAPEAFRPLDDLVTWNSDQSWNARRHYATADGRRVRVNIRRNAYDHQSFARLEGFDRSAMTWRTVVELPTNEGHFPAHGISYTQKQLTAGNIDALDLTCDLLLAAARPVLIEESR